MPASNQPRDRRLLPAPMIWADSLTARNGRLDSAEGCRTGKRRESSQRIYSCCHSSLPPRSSAAVARSRPACFTHCGDRPEAPQHGFPENIRFSNSRPMGSGKRPGCTRWLAANRGLDRMKAQPCCAIEVAILVSSFAIPELPESSITLWNSPGSFSRSNSSLRSQLK